MDNLDVTFSTVVGSLKEDFIKIQVENIKQVPQNHVFEPGFDFSKVRSFQTFHQKSLEMVKKSNVSIVEWSIQSADLQFYLKSVERAGLMGKKPSNLTDLVIQNPIRNMQKAYQQLLQLFDYFVSEKEH